MQPNDTTQRAPAPLAIQLIASCAIVALAYWLGAGWLGNRVLGIPGGVWGVGVVFASLRWGERHALSSWIDRFRGRGSVKLAKVREFLSSMVRPLASVPTRICRAASSARDGWSLVGNDPQPSVSGWSGVENRSERVRGSAGWRSSRIRVGLDLSDHMANRLIHTPGMKRIDWIQLRDHGMRAQEICRLHHLDAVVHRRGEQICVTPAEAGPFEPAWSDWSAATTPVTYASVFPMRADAARVSLGDTAFSDPVEREVASAIIESIVHLQHEPVRLGHARSDERASQNPMRHLARLIADRGETHSGNEGYQAACRAMTAWLSVTPVEWAESDVLGIVGACQGALGDEPEVLLRSAAVRFVLGDDDAAIEAVVRADRILRESGRMSRESQLPFVQSELNMGGDDPLAFGRIAAGLCLCGAQSSDEEFAFLRDDLLDEARFSEWLIGRDAERFVMMRVFRELTKRRDPGASSLFQAA